MSYSQTAPGGGVPFKSQTEISRDQLSGSGRRSPFIIPFLVGFWADSQLIRL
jgi:hypothetical protein